MPLLNPRLNDPEAISRLSAHQFNRTCLQRQVLLVHGKHFDEIRIWCDKIQHWKPHRVNSRLSWEKIFMPVL